MPYKITGRYNIERQRDYARILWYADSSGDCVFSFGKLNARIDRVVSFPTSSGGGGNHDFYLYNRFDNDTLQSLCVGLLDAPTNYETKVIFASVGTGLSVPVFTMQEHTVRITNASASDTGAIILYFKEFING